MTDTPRTGLEFVDAGTTDIDQPVNNNALALDAVVGMSVVSATTTAEPTLTSPADDGKVYILPAGRTGTNWGAQAVGTIAQWYSSNWYFYAPWAGLHARAADSGIRYEYTSSWAVWASVDAQLLLADTDAPRLGTANSWTSLQTINANASPGSVPAPQSGTLLHLAQSDGTACRTQLNAWANVNQFQGVRANGTIGAQTALANFDNICALAAFGYDGSAYTASARASIVFRADGAWTGSSHGTNWNLLLTPPGSTTADEVIICTTTQFFPNISNAVKLGAAGNLWSEVFAAIGAINTSDAREKTEVRPFTDAEISAAQALADEVGFFRFLESIERKGDSAREHCGMTVQRAIEIMEGHGLSPYDYGFICYDRWEEQSEIIDKETGEVVREYRPAGDRFGFRPDQLDRFIAKGIRENQKRIEARLSALESNK